MGRDKALIDFDGTPLWQRQREVLARAGAAEIFLSARFEQAWSHDAAGFSAVLADDVAGAGPLAGIVRALREASTSHLLVLAIDLPGIDAAWFAKLKAQCSADCGAVGRRDGFFEPLAAIYPVVLAESAASALARGERAVQRFVATAVASGGLRVHEIEAGEAGVFENWNEPTAVRAAPPG